MGENPPVRNEFVRLVLPTARYPNTATFRDTTAGCFEFDNFALIVALCCILVVIS
jgi:hypothetical protein